MTTADKSMGLALRAVRTLAESDLLDRVGLRKQVEKALYNGTREGFRVAGAAGRTFAAAQKLGRPARQKKTKPRELFDVTPDDDQQMLVEVTKQFAAEAVRPVAPGGRPQVRDAEGTARAGRRARRHDPRRPRVARRRRRRAQRRHQRPHRRGARARRHRHRRLHPRAGRGPHGARPVGRRRAAGEVPARPSRSEDAPPAALAIVEPRPLFNPLKLDTTAREGRRPASSSTA